MHIFRSIFIGLAVLFLAGAPTLSSASVGQARNPAVRLFLDPTTQSKGFTLTSQDHRLQLGVPANSLPQRNKIRVTLHRQDSVPKQISTHSKKQLYSEVYSFDVYNADTVWPTSPLWLKLHYVENDAPDLALAYWDNNQKSWIRLPSKQDTATQTVSAGVTVPFAYIALIQVPPPEVLESGYASWYDYPYAAHRTLPFGTLIKVTNTQNGESVVVEVRDRGPFVEGRVIDLPETAFTQIASLGAGVIPVTIQIVSTP